MKNFTSIACCGISNTELTLSKSSMEYAWEIEIYLGYCIQIIFKQIMSRSIRHQNWLHCLIGYSVINFKRYRYRRGALVMDDSEPVSWNLRKNTYDYIKRNKSVCSILKSEYFQGIHWDNGFFLKKHCFWIHDIKFIYKI